MPVYGYQIPLQKDKELFLLLRKITADYKDFIRIYDLKKELKLDINIIESIRRLNANIRFEDSSGKTSTSLISGYHFIYNDLDHEKLIEIAVSIYKGL